jgi:hypothetical protein
MRIQDVCRLSHIYAPRRMQIVFFVVANLSAASKKGRIVEKLSVEVVEDQLPQLRGGHASSRRHAWVWVRVGRCYGAIAGRCGCFDRQKE